jgi:hypothetical protein
MPNTTPLSFDNLPDARAKTEAVAQFLEHKLVGHVETLRPLLVPQRVLGRFVGGKEAVGNVERAYTQLSEQFQAVCPSLGLAPSAPDEELNNIDHLPHCYPWEYSYEAKAGKDSKSLTLTSPVRWVLTYKSAYSLNQFRLAVSGKGERSTRELRQFVVNALAMVQLLKAFPKLPQLMADLRFELRFEPLPNLGTLPFATLQACVPSYRPSDDMLITATRLSGIPGFIELIDLDALATLPDPLRITLTQLTQSS